MTTPASHCTHWTEAFEECCSCGRVFPSVDASWADPEGCPRGAARELRAEAVTYQYGVAFADGSIARRWNGSTQEQRAREYAADCRQRFPGDDFRVVRRPIGAWREVSS